MWEFLWMPKEDAKSPEVEGCRRLWATQKIWVLGTELRSCARRVKALNYRAIFSAPCNSLSYNSNLRKFTFFPIAVMLVVFSSCVTVVG